MSSIQHSDARLLAPPELLRVLAENWWLPVLRGIVGIVFGILAFVLPGITLATLVLLWGAFVLVDGVLAIVAAVKGGNPMPRWWLALIGLCGVVAGLLTFFMPGVTALVLLVFIAVWAIILGALDIYGAIRLRREIENEWLLIINGLAAILFGAILLWQPGVGALALIWLIGAYAIVFGILYIAFGLRLRKHKPA